MSSEQAKLEKEIQDLNIIILDTNNKVMIGDLPRTEFEKEYYLMWSQQLKICKTELNNLKWLSMLEEDYLSDTLSWLSHLCLSSALFSIVGSEDVTLSKETDGSSKRFKSQFKWFYPTSYQDISLSSNGSMKTDTSNTSLNNVYSDTTILNRKKKKSRAQCSQEFSIEFDAKNVFDEDIYRQISYQLMNMESDRNVIISTADNILSQIREMALKNRNYLLHSDNYGRQWRIINTNGLKKIS
mmetsp:Transcript_20320/g.18459  ORF Transcript_20320/g.18459 Transcript_20320/m.18459 type:complete len:241 (+) Transcript_20320:51-773(+)